MVTVEPETLVGQALVDDAGRHVGDRVAAVVGEHSRSGRGEGDRARAGERAGGTGGEPDGVIHLRRAGRVRRETHRDARHRSGPGRARGAGTDDNRRAGQDADEPERNEQPATALPDVAIHASVEEFHQFSAFRLTDSMLSTRSSSSQATGDHARRRTLTAQCRTCLQLRCQQRAGARKRVPRGCSRSLRPVHVDADTSGARRVRAPWRRPSQEPVRDFRLPLAHDLCCGQGARHRGLGRPGSLCRPNRGRLKEWQ